jgi:hypothetical protein
MFDIIIAIIAIFLFSSLALSVASFGVRNFTQNSPKDASKRNVRPFIMSKTGKTPMSLQIILALLLAAFVALGFVAVQ